MASITSSFTAKARRVLMFENGLVMYSEARKNVRHNNSAFTLINAHRTLINLMSVAETEDELRRVQAMVIDFSEDLEEGIRKFNEKRSAWSGGASA